MKLQNYFLVTFICLFLTACNPESETDSVETGTAKNSSLVTANILAAADAPFIMSQTVSYTAYNSSDTNITLFVYDESQNVMARQYIRAQNSADITVQLPIADSSLTQSWNYREFIQKEQVDVKGLSSVQFSGFTS